MNTLYRQFPGAKMKLTARKSISKWISIKKNPKGTSSGTHRVQDEPVRIAQTVDRWIAEKRVAKEYDIG